MQIKNSYIPRLDAAVLTEYYDDIYPERINIKLIELSNKDEPRLELQFNPAPGAEDGYLLLLWALLIDDNLLTMERILTIAGDSDDDDDGIAEYMLAGYQVTTDIHRRIECQ